MRGAVHGFDFAVAGFAAADRGSLRGRGDESGRVARMATAQAAAARGCRSALLLDRLFARWPYISSSTNSTHLNWPRRASLFDVAVERHGDLPRPREDLRVLDRRFVLDVIRLRHGVALGDLERFAVVIAGAIEPALIVEAAGLDDERAAVPRPDRLPHPRIDLRRPGILQIDVPDGAGIFVAR